ncbi:MAG TPA: hypothetical protein VFY20_06440 [Gemmatimonadales bacterium]|nr:hypothetical protein [Gemmatimonadales bacterium]
MIRRFATAGVLLVIACGKPAPPPVVDGATRDDVPADATTLGNELFELIDRAVEYRSAHMGRPADALRDLGVDSLTPTTARLLTGTAPIAFTSTLRRAGDGIVACSATEDVLEQASLNEGRFTVACESAAEMRTYEVARPVPAAPR